MQKAARKNTKYWRNETSFKIGHFAKAIAHVKALQNGQFGSQVKHAENMVKTIV